ncbi:MAG: cobalt transporter CbiM [Candidatus Latescibacteria bacterium]|nr:cobalt transporter CbiM [Candidatus Latescibacterota bacterium]
MHIPDGYLSPQTYLPLLGGTLACWSVALKKMKTQLATRQIPYLAMATAFSFLIMMFNIPIPGGTTGHAVGAGIVALLLGPWTAVIAISVVLIIQAVIFGDGGITAIGANCFNMAVATTFVSYWTFRLLSAPGAGPTRLAIAAFGAGYLGLTAGALLTALEFGIQPLIAQGPDGRPLYAPYPLAVAMPAMLLEHLLLFSVAEGLVTALLLRYFIKHEPESVFALTRKGG